MKKEEIIRRCYGGMKERHGVETIILFHVGDSFEASGGGMIEKCVYGKLGTEKETVKPLQFSVSGAVGAQFNATKRVGIYVEPGVAYFFDDGSDVQTIRKENPFNFNIQAGIRLTY